jgi:hypothetical protein
MSIVTYTVPGTPLSPELPTLSPELPSPEFPVTYTVPGIPSPEFLDVHKKLLTI